MTPRAVFLDRDGVIVRAPIVNRRPTSPMTLDELEILPGTPAALASLRAAAYNLVVITNQPDVARGRQSRERIEAMHDMLTRHLGLCDIRVCYHDDGDECRCRKPSPGMILDAAGELGLDLRSSFVIGDRWRDVGAGRRAGCRTILIDYAYDEVNPFEPDVKVSSLAEAVGWILERNP